LRHNLFSPWNAKSYPPRKHAHTEGSRRHRRLGARNTRKGKASHRGHGGHREGIGGWGRNYLPGTPPLRARATRPRGKHRTEVTEVTEGDPRLGAEPLAGDTTRSGARNTCKGKASHGGHIGHGEAIGDWGCWVNVLTGTTLAWARKQAFGLPRTSGVSVFLCGGFLSVNNSCFAWFAALGSFRNGC
jgi:hypothetical protein